MILCSQAADTASPSSTPVEGEDASKITEASSVLVVRLPFYQFSVISHTVYAVVTQRCYIFVLLFSKMFDIELCPLPFSMEEMFGFISCRFTGYPSSVQEQALLWLHVSVLCCASHKSCWSSLRFWKRKKKHLGVGGKKPVFQGSGNLSALWLAPV